MAMWEATPSSRPGGGRKDQTDARTSPPPRGPSAPVPLSKAKLACAKSSTPSAPLRATSTALTARLYVSACLCSVFERPPYAWRSRWGGGGWRQTVRDRKSYTERGRKEEREQVAGTPRRCGDEQPSIPRNAWLYTATTRHGYDWGKVQPSSKIGSSCLFSSDGVMCSRTGGSFNKVYWRDAKRES